MRMTVSVERALVSLTVTVALVVVLGLDRFVADGRGTWDETSAGRARAAGMIMPSYEGVIGQNGKDRASYRSAIRSVTSDMPAVKAEEWSGFDTAKPARRHLADLACATRQPEVPGSTGALAEACLVPGVSRDRGARPQRQDAADQGPQGQSADPGTIRLIDRPRRSQERERTRRLLADAGFSGRLPAPHFEDLSFAANNACETGEALSLSPVIGRMVETRSTDRGPFASGIAIDLPEHCGLRSNVDGMVVFSGVFRNYGPLLIIAHDGEYHSVVAGMASLAVGVGDRISRNQVLGRVDRGCSGTERVHVEVRRSGSPIDSQSHVGRFATKAQG